MLQSLQIVFDLPQLNHAMILHVFFDDLIDCYFSALVRGQKSPLIVLASLGCSQNSFEPNKSRLVSHPLITSSRIISIILPIVVLSRNLSNSSHDDNRTEVDILGGYSRLMYENNLLFNVLWQDSILVLTILCFV